MLGLACVAWAEDDGALKTLTLQEALAELDSQSPTLVEVRSRVADARAAAAQAAVPLVPTVLAAGGYTRNSADAIVDLSNLRLLNLPAGALPSGPLVIQPLGVWTVSGSVRVPLIIPTRGRLCGRSARGRCGGCDRGIGASAAACLSGRGCVGSGCSRGDCGRL